MDIVILKALTDNYIYLVRDRASGVTAVVDPTEAPVVLHALQERQWPLHYILNTHHHWDHVGGNQEIQKATGARVIASQYDKMHQRIAEVSRGVSDQETFLLGTLEVTTLAIPGHTLGHVAYWFAKSHVLFSGDTLFSVGCGRLFEGTAGQMWSSLLKLRALPDTTRVYSGHEYTLTNLDFALSLEPESSVLGEKRKQVADWRASDLPSVPSLLGEEKKLNPFLRADDWKLAKRLNLGTAGPVKVFAQLRRRKDGFRSPSL